MIISEALKIAKEKLKNVGIETYSLDSELILCEVTGFNKTKLFIENEYMLSKEEEALFNAYLERREKKEPIAYIFGRQEFMALSFKVNSYTLIPRPDTEVLVEKLIEEVNSRAYKRLLDIGTGSGAIAVSTLKYTKDSSFDAVDISQGALDTAKENAENNGVSERISFIKSDIYENIENQKYDVIVSNPPYIRTEVIDGLEDNVKKYEPFSALDGGKDGLYFYRKITEGAIHRLNNKGLLIYEIGYDQAEEVSELMEKAGFKEIKVLKDLAGLDRVVYGYLK